MLQVKCLDHLKQVRDEAAKRGLLEKLEGWLKYLQEYGCPDDDPERTVVELFSDFAPLSFYFQMWWKCDDEHPQAITVEGFYGKYRRGLNGGLIWHGASDDWSVHT